MLTTKETIHTSGSKRRRLAALGCGGTITRIRYRARPEYLAACLFLILSPLNLQANTYFAQNNSDVLETPPVMPSHSIQKLTPPTIEHCENLLTHSDPVAIEPLRKPPHMKLFRDPAFATRNRRISNSIEGEVHRPIGHSAQSWNSDESLLLLHKFADDKTTKFILMDGSTYQQLGDLNITAAVNDSVYWSRENLLSVFYVADSDDKAGQLLRFDIATGTESLIKDFSPYCEQSGFTAIGGKFPKPSSNDDLFSFQCGSESGKSLVLSYRYFSDEVHSLAIGKGTQWKLNLPPEPIASGENFLFQGYSIDDTLKTTIEALNMPESNFPYRTSQDSAGNDVVYQLAQSSTLGECSSSEDEATGMILKHSLNSGDCNSFVAHSKNYSMNAGGSTLFTDAEHAPDWAAMSSIGYGEFDNFAKDTPAPTLFSELFLVNTGRTDQQEICRIAHHRSFGKHAKNASYEAFLGEPTLSLSPSGTRVLFSSDWYDSGSVDTFVVELPSFTRLQLDGEWADNQRPSMVTRFAQAGAKFAFSRVATDATDENAEATTGSGHIRGKQIDLDYVTTVSNKQVSGKCTASVKRDVDNITFSCDNKNAGLADFSIVRKRLPY